jgi:hypothetical protein
VTMPAVALKADFVHLDRLPQMPVRVRHVNVTMPRQLPVRTNQFPFSYP